MVKCKTGLHEWINKEDAEKCCNGFRRVLIMGNISHAEKIISDILPGGIRYGYRWVEDK